MANIVEYEVRGKVAIITLNRPEARNAVNGDVASGLEAAIDKLEADSNVWIGVLAANTAGQERPVFCAGADLKAINSGQAAGLNTKRGGFGGFVYRDRKKPVIAAVDGLATAGGCELVLACDMLVASTRSAFGLFSAQRAYELGMVNKLVEPNASLDAAIDLALRVCKAAPLAVWASRKIVLASETESDQNLIDMTNKEFAAVLASEDTKEGLTAFIEKRPPNWQGK